MRDLFIKMTSQTPEIDFKANGNLSIKGVSIPENSYAFYSEAMLWLKEFESCLPDKVILNLEFEYINTASSSSIIEIIKTILKYKQKRIDFKVNWIYQAEDEDALEQGEDLAFCLNIQFAFVPVKG